MLFDPEVLTSDSKSHPHCGVHSNLTPTSVFPDTHLLLPQSTEQILLFLHFAVRGTSVWKPLSQSQKGVWLGRGLKLHYLSWVKGPTPSVLPCNVWWLNPALWGRHFITACTTCSQILIVPAYSNRGNSVLKHLYQNSLQQLFHLLIIKTICTSELASKFVCFPMTIPFWCHVIHNIL